MGVADLAAALWIRDERRRLEGIDTAGTTASPCSSVGESSASKACVGSGCAIDLGKARSPVFMSMHGRRTARRRMLAGEAQCERSVAGQIAC